MLWHGIMFYLCMYVCVCVCVYVGESGLGKSTLINTLFKSKISRTSCTPPPHTIPQTVEVSSVSHVIEEQGVRLKLTVTDTPGFGDKINNDKWYAVLVLSILSIKIVSY